MKAIRRFDEPTKVGAPQAITFEEARTRFPSRVVKKDKNPLKPGSYNKKLGDKVIKGKWKGMPLYSLSLEERATCPRSCKVWSTCYGNHMPFAKRMKWSETMKRDLITQLSLLNEKHKKGFVVRLHVLGDFIDEDYARMWFDLLDRFPRLHVFGYTAREWSFLHKFALDHWDRFAIRLSGWTMARGSYVSAKPTGRGIVCPAQTGRTDCCGTCGLCWATQKPINFLEH